jgi:hypothetical protein
MYGNLQIITLFISSTRLQNLTYIIVSDSVADAVMSSLQTCNMNHGCRREGLGGVKKQGVNS